MRSTTVRAAAILALMVPMVALAAPKKPYEKIKAPKLGAIQTPQIKRLTLDNGLQVFVVEDHELPLFRLTLTLKAGTFCDPADKVGLAEITTEVLRTGGSEMLPGDKMDEVLENMGGSIEVSAQDLSTTVGVNVLVEDTDKALAMVRDLLLHPAYPADKLDLALKQSRSAIARRNDDPGEIADREFDKILYGAGHPFARQTEYEHLDRIKREDLVAFHQKYFHPQDAYLALWGDFDTNQIVERVRAVLGEWPKANVTYPEIPPVPATTPSVNVGVKESVNQSNILMGHRGTTQKDPDYYALSVMNEVLGGGFGARLFSEVRSRQGLSYRVGAGLGAGLAYPGMFTVQCGTKSETTLKAVNACIAEIRKMKTNPPTALEVERAKASILNSHVFNFTNKGAIVNRQIAYVRNGYPPDFMEQFKTGIEAVTLEQVRAAAGKYLQPDQFAILVVGKPADFDGDLASLGKVNTIDISIPVPAATEDYPAATAENLAKGATLLADAAKAIGGVDAIRKVLNLTEQSTVTLSMMGQQIPAKLTRYRQYPGSVRSELEVMGQKMIQAYSAGANAGFTSARGQVMDMDSDDIEETRSDIARDVLNFLRDPAPYAPQWIGEANVGGAPADVVLMSPAGLKKFKVFVDRKSRFIIKQEGHGKNFQGAPVHEEVFMDGFKKSGTLIVPHKVRVLQDGQEFLNSETNTFGWDPIPADKFKKSAG